MKNTDIAKDTVTDGQALPAQANPPEAAAAQMAPVPGNAPRHGNANGGHVAGRQRAPQSLLEKISAKAAEQRLGNDEDEDELDEVSADDAGSDTGADEAPAESVDAGGAADTTPKATEQAGERSDTHAEGSSGGFLSGLPPIAYALGAAGIVGGGIAIFRGGGGSTIAAPDAKLKSDTGASATDFITKDGTIDVSGIVTGNTWEYSTNGGTSWTAGSNTSFALAEGTYAAGSIQVRQKDAGGQIGEIGKIASAVTVDATAPAAPVINAVAGDNVVNRSEAEASVSVSGTGEAGSKLTVAWGEVTKVVTVGQDGTWTAEFANNEVPASGSYAITASAADLAGNVSETATHDVVVDRQNYVSGTVAAGPVVAGLEVKAYMEDGTLLASGVTDAAGSFRMGYTDYSGLVLVSVVDPSANSEGFIDEATGQQTDLMVMLRAVKAVAAGEDVVINITPLTEVATRLMAPSLNSAGVTGLAGVTAQQVLNANAMVAKLFSDQADVLLTSQALKLVIDATGAVTSDSASIYGVYLAAIQGWSLKQGQTLEQTIAEIVDVLQGHQSLGTAVTRTDLGLTDAQKLADIFEQGFETIVDENPHLATALLPASTIKALGFVNDADGPAFEGGASISKSVAENVAAGQVAFTASATDPTGGVTYALTGSSAFAIDARTGVVTVVDALDYEKVESYSFTITATDLWGNTSSQTVNLAVTNVNEAPEVTNALVDQSASVGQSFTYAIADDSFTDLDANTTLTYSATLADGSPLPTWLSFDSVTGTFSATSTQELASPVTIRVTASDGSLTASDEFTLNTVTAPAITAISAGVAAANSGDSVEFTVTFSEAVTFDGPYSGVTLIFDNGAFTATGVGQSSQSTYTFAGTIAGGDFSKVTLTGITLNGVSITGQTTNQALLTDKVGQVVAGFVIDNTNPTVTSTAVTAAENGTAVATLTAGEGVTWELDGNGGDNSLFDLSSAGVLTFKAAKNYEVDAKSYNVAVTATDSAGNSTDQTVAVTLTNVNEAPVVAKALVDQAVILGQSFTYGISTDSFTDPDAATTLTYTATLSDGSALPAWLSFNAGTRTFSATSAEALDKPITIKVTASDGTLSVSDEFTLDNVTAPVFSTLVNGINNLDVRSNLVLKTEDNIALTTEDGTYQIVISNDANTSGKQGYYGDLGESVDHTQTIEVTVIEGVATATVNGSAVSLSEVLTISDNMLIINPYYDLDFSNNYHLEIDAGLFVGTTSGQGNVALEAEDATFATVTPNTFGSGPALLTNAEASQIMVDVDGTVAFSKRWIGLDQVGSTANTAAADLGSVSSGAYAFVMTDRNPNPATPDSLGISTWDVWAKVTDFESDDLLYIDNQQLDHSGDWDLANTYLSDGFYPDNYYSRIENDTSDGGTGVFPSSSQAWFDFYVDGEYYTQPSNIESVLGAPTPMFVGG